MYVYLSQESKYGSKGTQNSMLKRKDQWKKIKIKTVFQVAKNLNRYLIIYNRTVLLYVDGTLCSP